MTGLDGAGASLEIRLVRSREHVFLSGCVVHVRRYLPDQISHLMLAPLTRYHSSDSAFALGRVCRAFRADIFHPCA
jgi:hypothetical protein